MKFYAKVLFKNGHVDTFESDKVDTSKNEAEEHVKLIRNFLVDSINGGDETATLQVGATVIRLSDVSYISYWYQWY